jgi:hypothetical protein
LNGDGYSKIKQIVKEAVKAIVSTTVLQLKRL